MAGIRDITIVDSNTRESKKSESETIKILCSPDLCGSSNLTVYRRTIAAGRGVDVQAGNDYHLVYVIAAPGKGVVQYNNASHELEDGAGVLLVPGEAARFEAAASAAELLQMVVPKPPA